MSNENFTYKSPTHVANLNGMRLSGKLSDVTIKVENKELRAHKVILAANLKYFEYMFLNSFEESKQGVITMKDVDESDFEAIVTYAYTGEILITKDNALGLFEIANYLTEDRIKEACIEFLKVHMKKEEACQAYKLANLIKCSSLKDAAKHSIFSNFGDCSQTIEYLDLDFESLKGLINDVKFENNGLQQLLFEGIMRWIMHDSKERRSHVNDLLSLIDVANLAAAYLMNYLGNLADRSDDADFGIVKDIMSYYHRCSKIQQMKQLSNCSAQVLMLLDDFDGKRFFHYYNFTEKKWSALQEIPNEHGDIYCHTTVLQDRVYYITSVVYYSDIIGYHSEEFHLEVFNPATKQTTTLQSSNDILRDWGWPGLCACSRFVYLCGGSVDTNSSNQVVKYDPQTCSFETMTPLQNKRSGAAAIFYQGSLHVLGGYSTRDLNSVEKYDPDTKQWVEFPSMIEPRSYHAAAVLDGKLYACGGDNTVNVEVYDPATNRWRQVASMNKEREQFIVVALEGQLWAIGGDSEKTVEVYDPSKNQWRMDDEMSSGLKMQYPAGGLISASCVTMTFSNAN